MWNKGNGSEEADSATSALPAGDIGAFFGKGVTFKGNIVYNGTLQIDGLVDGEIQTNGTLILGDEAEVRGKITAGTLISRGRVTADVIAAQAVKLLKPAVLDGTVQTPVFVIEEGVRFTGRCAMSEGVIAKTDESGPRLVKL